MGFVDVGIVLSNVLHLVELKVLTAAFVGPAQLADYMAKEHRPEGWLVVIDTRPDHRKTTLHKTIRVKQGLIHVIQVDVNPVAPSKKKSA